MRSPAFLDATVNRVINALSAAGTSGHELQGVQGARPWRARRQRRAGGVVSLDEFLQELEKFNFLKLKDELNLTVSSRSRSSSHDRARRGIVR